MTVTDITTWRDCRCGARIQPSASGTYWVDAEGWDTCADIGDSHAPVDVNRCAGSSV